LAQDSYGADRLIYGSGFGYIGHDVENISRDRLELIFSSMEDYVSKLFPDAFHAALEDGSLRASKKYCIRPWTPTSLGVFEVEQAHSGCLIIASGHNTGGFSQSPSVAKAAIAAMRGEMHLMHRIYHPDRFKAFWGNRA
jgi:D-amino-acid dehydrogenase